MNAREKKLLHSTIWMFNFIVEPKVFNCSIDFGDKNKFEYKEVVARMNRAEMTIDEYCYLFEELIIKTSKKVRRKKA